MLVFTNVADCVQVNVQKKEIIKKLFLSLRSNSFQINHLQKHAPDTVLFASFIKSSIFDFATVLLVFQEALNSSEQENFEVEKLLDYLVHWSRSQPNVLTRDHKHNFKSICADRNWKIFEANRKWRKMVIICHLQWKIYFPCFWNGLLLRASSAV